MILVISIIILAITIIIGISLFIGVFGVPYVPTPITVITFIQKHNLITQNQTIIELGSGDARLLRYCARNLNTQGTGYEISPLFYVLGYVLSFIQTSITKKGSITPRFKSYFDADLKDADIVYVYLLPHTLKKLIPLFDTMKPGSTIISYTFNIPTFTPTEEYLLDNGKYLRVYKR